MCAPATERSGTTLLSFLLADARTTYWFPENICIAFYKIIFPFESSLISYKGETMEYFYPLGSDSPKEDSLSEI